MATVDLDAKAVLFIKTRIEARFGESFALSNPEALDSALARPRATFEGTELYPTMMEKAAALLESLCNNQPFDNGNKRISFTACGLFLKSNGVRLSVGTEEGIEFMLNLADGKLGKEEIRIWLEGRSETT